MILFEQNIRARARGFFSFSFFLFNFSLFVFPWLKGEAAKGKEGLTRASEKCDRAGLRPRMC